MWFKQAQIFQLPTPIHYVPDSLEEQLAPLAFTPCLPSLATSHGWVSPIDKEDAPLVHAAHGYMLICMQREEKVLPAAVIRQELNERVKHIESQQGQKIAHKEKNALKAEITSALLTRAFSKLSRIYAFIDTEHHRLILDTTTTVITEKFLELFKRSLPNYAIQAIDVRKLAPILTHWLLDNEYPSNFSIETSCVLIDPQQTNRVIRCQQQDLLATAIQSLLKDGCQVNQLSLNWQDKVNFTLMEDCSLKTIKYQDAIVSLAKDQYSESKEQQFDTDFLIMAETFKELLHDLLELFAVE